MKSRPRARPRRTSAPAASVSPAEKRRARAMLARLETAHPDARCALDHADPFQLAVATILSAQCTDERVNRVTPALFQAFPTPRALADAPEGAIETLIRSTGFFRAKARNLRGLSRMLEARFDGRVPDRMEDLVALPGVARKTASVVLGVAFGKAEGVVVDTHVTRLARRMGLTDQRTPERIERDLMALFPRSRWIALAHVLIFHGRRVCLARSPRCNACPVAGMCPKAGVKPA